MAMRIAPPESIRQVLLHMLPSTEDVQKAIPHVAEKLMKRGRHLEAARLVKEVDGEKSKEAYAKAAQKELDAGNRVRAAEIINEHIGWFGRKNACALAERCVKENRLKEAGELFSMAGEFYKAAQAFEKIGDWRNASKSYSNILGAPNPNIFSKSKRAHENAKALGPEPAKPDPYAVAKDALVKARRSERKEDHIEAARLHCEIGDFKAAAKIYEQMRREFRFDGPKEIRSMYRKEAELHILAGNPEDALRLLIRAGSFES